MKIKLLFLILLSIIYSCSNNDEFIESPPPVNIIPTPNKISCNFPFMGQSSPNVDTNYYYQYDSQGRVTKRVGGFLYLSGSTGFPSFFVNADLYRCYL